MFTLLRRQRRRLLTCGLSIAAAFAVKMTLFMTFDPTMPFPANITLAILACTAAAIIGLALGVLIAAIILLTVPRQRSAAELICIMAFFGILGFPYFPYVTVIDGQGASGLGLWGLTLLLALAFAVNSLLNGTALDRTRLRPTLREQHRFMLPIPQEDAWRLLVPGEAPPEGHWDPLLYSLAPLPDRPGTFDVLYAHGMSLFEHREIQMLERAPPRHARYEHKGEVSSIGLIRGINEIDIEPNAAGSSIVTLRSVRKALLPRVAWHLWLDDALADSADFIRNRQSGATDWTMTGRYRREVGRID